MSGSSSETSSVTSSEHHQKPPLIKTPLYNLHTELGGKMVPFAGYDMPVQYPLGILKEHLHVREACGLFDVSHMGQAELVGPDAHTVATALEALVPGAIATLKPSHMRYTLLMNDDGGILDDMMVTNVSDETVGRFFLVVNAACKDNDYAFLKANLPDNVELNIFHDKALLALQGPKAADVLSRFCHGLEDLVFMKAIPAELFGVECFISRAGYTGEDGFEISVANEHADHIARHLINEDDVEIIGLGARDSLRLEAGLCLYGHDIDATTSPVEANLVWAIAKKRRESGGFKGDTRVLQELASQPKRLLVGLKPKGRAPAREGTVIQSVDGQQIGTVTSGGYAPSVGGPIALGYVAHEHAKTGHIIHMIVRGKALEAEVVTTPFVPQRYYRKKI